MHVASGSSGIPISNDRDSGLQSSVIHQHAPRRARNGRYPCGRWLPRGLVKPNPRRNGCRRRGCSSLRIRYATTASVLEPRGVVRKFHARTEFDILSCLAIVRAVEIAVLQAGSCASRWESRSTIGTITDIDGFSARRLVRPQHPHERNDCRRSRSARRGCLLVPPNRRVEEYYDHA